MYSFGERPRHCGFCQLAVTYLWLSNTQIWRKLLIYFGCICFSWYLMPCAEQSKISSLCCSFLTLSRWSEQNDSQKLCARCQISKFHENSSAAFAMHQQWRDAPYVYSGYQWPSLHKACPCTCKCPEIRSHSCTRNGQEQLISVLPRQTSYQCLFLATEATAKVIERYQPGQTVLFRRGLIRVQSLPRTWNFLQFLWGGSWRQQPRCKTQFPDPFRMLWNRRKRCFSCS